MQFGAARARASGQVAVRRYRLPASSPSTLLVALSIATALTAIVLAAMAWLLPRQREREERRALADYAEFYVSTVLDNAYWEVARTMHDRLFVPSRESLLGSDGSAPTDEPLPSLTEWQRASDGVDRDRLVPRLDERIRFRFDERDQLLLTSGDAPSAQLRRSLVDMLAKVPRTYGDAPTFLAGRPLEVAIDFPGTRGPGLGVALRARHRRDGTRVLYGYVADVRPVLALALHDMMGRAPLFPRSVAVQVPNDSLISLVLTTDSDDTLFASAPIALGDSTTTPMRFRNDAFGGVRASLLPRSRAARLFPPATSSSAVLTVLTGLLIALLGLTLAAVWVGRRATAMARARVNFLASVSHEFRTPLAQIVLAAESLPPGSESAMSIFRGADRLTRLVDNVIQFARSDRAAVETRHELIRLAPLVEDLVEQFWPLASESEVVIALDLEPDIRVRANREAIARITLNLLDNAVRYGACPQLITVSLVAAGPMVRLLVDDEGTGIQPADCDRVFEPFVRLEPGGPVAGSGIGLSVVRDAARSLGGSARIERAPRGGTRVIVELPIADHDASARQSLSDESDASCADLEPA